MDAGFAERLPGNGRKDAGGRRLSLERSWQQPAHLVVRSREALPGVHAIQFSPGDFFLRASRLAAQIFSIFIWQCK